MSRIENVKAREILDSRGNPTIEVDITTSLGNIGRASVPSGASTGTNEALELRDNDERYFGRGVKKAVYNVNNIISKHIIGMDVTLQKEIDDLMIKLDGTPNKSSLGANAILGVSLAVLKAAALDNDKPLYKYIGDGTILPVAMMNIINGGAHANNNIDFQEFMIIPSASTFKERLRMGSEVFHCLKRILNKKGFSTAVGDEGGFAPNLNSNNEALELIIEAINEAGYVKGEDVTIGLDVASNEFYENGLYNLKGEGKILTSKEIINYYKELCNSYPIVLIEDGLAEEDYEGWKLISRELSNIQLVGDDVFVTNKKLLKKGIYEGFANSIIIKANQVGTVSETIETINLAKENNYKTIISHRSGETEDTYIADLAVGLNLGQIKTGSLSRSERISKYNQLLRIEEELDSKK